MKTRIERIKGSANRLARAYNLLVASGDPGARRFIRSECWLLIRRAVGLWFETFLGKREDD